MQGEYQFDPVYWPDPAAMIQELEALGIKLMVSVWPTIDRNSSQFAEMHAKGLLVRTERGVATTMEFLGDTVFFDPTNPKAREHVWRVIKQNYYDKGVRIFWLDEAEPEYAVYDFDNYRYHLGSNLQVGNTYPLKYAQCFYEGMAAEKQENIVNLLRCAWAGSQDTVLSFGRAISIRASNRSVSSSLRALTWGSLEFPGGPQISEDSTPV